MYKGWIIMVALIWVSCSTNTLVNTLEPVSKTGWEYEHIPAFSFHIQDTTYLYEAFVNLQINETYKYRNLYLVIHMRNPNGQEIQNRVNLELSHDDGRWLGSGSANKRTFQLPVSTELQFAETGEYIVGLEQNMRDSALIGVEAVGIEIRRGNPVY